MALEQHDGEDLTFSNHATTGLRYNDFFFLIALLFVLFIVLIMVCVAAMYATKWTYKRRTKEKLEAEKERHRKEEEQWKDAERKLQEDVERKQERHFHRELLKAKAAEKPPTTIIKMERPPSPKKVDSCQDYCSHSRSHRRRHRRHHRGEKHRHSHSHSRSRSCSPRKIREIHIPCAHPPAPPPPPPPAAVNTVFVPQPFFTPMPSACPNNWHPEYLARSHRDDYGRHKRASREPRPRREREREYDCYFDPKVKSRVPDDDEARSRHSDSNFRKRRRHSPKVERSQAKRSKSKKRSKVRYSCSETAGPDSTETAYSSLSRAASVPDLRSTNINRRPPCPTVSTVPSTTVDSSSFLTTETRTEDSTVPTTSTVTDSEAVTGTRTTTTTTEGSLGPPAIATSPNTVSVEMPPRSKQKRQRQVQVDVETKGQVQSPEVASTWTPRKLQKPLATHPEALAGYVKTMMDSKQTTDGRQPQDSYVLVDNEDMDPAARTPEQSIPIPPSSGINIGTPIISSTPAAMLLNHPPATPDSVIDMSNDPFCNNFPYWRSRTTNQPVAVDVSQVDEDKFTSGNRNRTPNVRGGVRDANGAPSSKKRQVKTANDLDISPGPRYKAQVVSVDKTQDS